MKTQTSNTVKKGSTKKVKNPIANDLIRSNVNRDVAKQEDKRHGVLQTILNAIQKKEQTKDSLLKVLAKAFPDRDLKSMEKTIKAQLGSGTRPCRMEKERGIELAMTTRVVKGHDQIFFSFVGQKDWSVEESESEE